MQRDTIIDSLRHALTTEKQVAAAYLFGYLAVDPMIIRDIVEHRLGDLRVFAASIRRGITGRDELRPG